MSNIDKHIIITVIMCFAFVAMILMMMFVKGSKTYNEGANMPLDDSISGDTSDIEKIDGNIKREE